MTVDLFLRTYNKDVQWLPFLFRSLCRHARGFRKLIVVTPSASTDVVKQAVDRFSSRLVISGAVSEVVLAECSVWPDDYNG